MRKAHRPKGLVDLARNQAAREHKQRRIDSATVRAKPEPGPAPKPAATLSPKNKQWSKDMLNSTKTDEATGKRGIVNEFTGGKKIGNKKALSRIQSDVLDKQEYQKLKGAKK